MTNEQILSIISSIPVMRSFKLQYRTDLYTLEPEYTQAGIRVEKIVDITTCFNERKKNATTSANLGSCATQASNKRWVVRNRVIEDETTGRLSIRFQRVNRYNEHTVFIKIDKDGNRTMISKEEAAQHTILKTTDTPPIVGVTFDNILKIEPCNY